MSMYGGERSFFENQNPSEQYESVRQATLKPPLGILNLYIDEWTGRAVSPTAVVTALGHLTQRTLSENETRNAAAWMKEQINHNSKMIDQPFPEPEGEPRFTIDEHDRFSAIDDIASVRQVTTAQNIGIITTTQLKEGES